MKFLLFIFTLSFISFGSSTNVRSRRHVLSTTLRALPTIQGTNQIALSYRVQSGVDNTAVQSAFNIFESQTCITSTNLDTIQPIPPANQEDIQFVSGTQCVSSGYGLLAVGTPRVITLSTTCATIPEIQRLIGHALGLRNEEVRPDREGYVRIITANVIPQNISEFNIDNLTVVKASTINYDYGSLMQSPLNYLSANGQNTMRLVYPNFNRTVGQRLGYGFNDLKLINMEYCSNICTGTNTCENFGYQNPRNCSLCICPPFFTGQNCQLLESNQGGCGSQRVSVTRKRKVVTVNGNRTCLIRFRAPPGQRVKLTIVKAKLPGGVNCWGTKGIEAKLFNDKSVAGAKFCGRVTNRKMRTEGNIALVRYRGANSNHMMRLRIERARN
uniref:Metalloendopeptidase n=1 Tax=Parastrongyloides trichosuri TaxID=131310 RepID=A0A0N4Z7F4_PARTI